MKTEHIYQDYHRCIVRITTRNSHGDAHCGAGFHIGNGWIVTAAHIAREEITDVSGDMQQLTVSKVIINENPRIDLALLKTDFNLDHYMFRSSSNDPRRNKAKTDFIPLGLHLDDWIADESFVLSRVVLFGFPRVPQSERRDLVVVAGEVNAVIDKYTGPHPYFIISPLARGGFSGGPVISEFGFLLGVLVESLTESDQPELGFAAAISVEPLLTMLGEYGIRPPDFDDEQWDLIGPRSKGELPDIRISRMELFVAALRANLRKLWWCVTSPFVKALSRGRYR